MVVVTICLNLLRFLYKGTKNSQIMNKRERAIMDMGRGFKAELTASASIYVGNTDFEDEVAAFNAALQVSEDALKAAYPENQGYSEEKAADKIKLATNVSTLTATAFVKLENQGKISLAEQLFTEPSDFDHVADSECGARAEAMHDIMLTNIEAINSKAITTEVLVELLKEITAFKESKGTSQKEHQNSPVLTKAFKDSLVPLQKRVDYLRYLVRVYQKSKPDFYERVMATSAIPAIHVYHTYIIITAILKSTGKPAPGITFALAKAKKNGTTDRDGILNFEEVRSGEDVLTGTSEGKEVVYKKVKIKRSTTNEWEVVIEGM